MFLCLMTATSEAQEKADILVSYDYTFPNLRTGKVECKNQYMLLANSNVSKFYSPGTEYIDSLNSTPQGKAALNEMTAIAVKSGNYDQIPNKDGSFYVTKTATTVRCYDYAGTERYVVEENLPEMDWEVCDSVKTILGYECMKATVTFHGRQWVAWFTPEIPIMSGPWKLGGLPELILEAEADNQYKFEATGLQQSRKTITKVLLAETYEKISRKDFLRVKRSFTDNPLGSIDAQFGGKTVSVIDAYGNSIAENERIYVTREVADFIETDY